MLGMLEETEIRARDGSRAALRSDDDGEVLETRDGAGRLIFTFHPATGRAVVHVAGPLEVRSQQAIRFRGRSISLEAEDEVRLTTPGAAAQLAGTALALEAGKLTVGAESLAVNATRIQSESREVRLRTELLDQVVGRALLWAREVVQRVDGLLSAQAGRVRVRSEADYTLHSQVANLTAREEFRVQGDTIHLG